MDGLSVYGATSLSEVVQFLRGEKELAVVPTQPWTAHKIRDESDFSEVKGHTTSGGSFLPKNRTKLQDNHNVSSEYLREMQIQWINSGNQAFGLTTKLVRA